MSGIYWGLTVMDLMGELPRMNREEITDFIKSCQHDCGGFSASIGHDPHLLYTLSAVQVMFYCFIIKTELVWSGCLSEILALSFVLCICIFELTL